MRDIFTKLKIFFHPRDSSPPAHQRVAQAVIHGTPDQFQAFDQW
jgi:hypothetical protein